MPIIEVHRREMALNWADIITHKTVMPGLCIFAFYLLLLPLSVTNREQKYATLLVISVAKVIFGSFKSSIICQFNYYYPTQFVLTSPTLD